MQAFMMVTALAWPIIVGAFTGFICGLLRRHGLVGTIVDIIAGGAVGYGLSLLVMLLGGGIPPSLSLPISLGTPVVGGLIGVWLKGKLTG